MLANILLIAAVCVFVVAMYMAYSCATKNTEVSVEEGFATQHRHAWGYPGKESSTYSSEHTPQVRGPDPNNPTLVKWQYHPQNTLVDYRFYRTPECSAAHAEHRMAPVVDGRIGTVNQDPVSIVNMEGDGGAYVYTSPASNKPCDHPSPEYTYSQPAQEVPSSEEDLAAV